jgi:hypothetical protein
MQFSPFLSHTGNLDPTLVEIPYVDRARIDSQPLICTVVRALKDEIVDNSVEEPHHLYEAPAPGKHFYAAPCGSGSATLVDNTLLSSVAEPEPKPQGAASFGRSRNVMRLQLRLRRLWLRQWY